MSGMIRKKKNVTISIKWYFFLLSLLVQIPFYWLFSYIGQTSIHQMNRQLADSQLTALNAFATDISRQMTSADQLLFADFWPNESFIDASDETESRLIDKLLEEDVEKAEKFISDKKAICAILFFRGDIDYQRIITGDPTKMQTMDMLPELILEKPVHTNLGWFLAERNGHPYFVRYCLRDGMYCAAVMDLTDITYRSRSDYKLSGSVVFRDGERLLTEAYWTRGIADGIEQDQAGDSYYFVSQDSHRYIVTETPLAAMTLVYGTEYLQSTNWWNLCTAILFVCILVSFAFSLFYLYTTTLRPLNQLVSVMQEIREGNTQLRAPKSYSRELSGISSTFNGMLDTLDRMKISVYESQLQAKKSEIDALRLQIRRHFFLNCLKNIYAMASSGEIEEVKQTALLLSENLRYTLDFTKNAIDLSTEMKMCRDYIELQGVGQDIKPSLSVSLDPELADFRIPPVSILTLLENCCKYAPRHDCPLKVSISAIRRHMDGREYVCIAISDNGPGFPPEILSQLNNGMIIGQGNRHIGLDNTTMRMKLMYGEECQALYTNINGARIEWIIPTNGEKEFGNDETVNS